jgi:hypothetical protein
LNGLFQASDLTGIKTTKKAQCDLRLFVPV